MWVQHGVIQRNRFLIRAVAVSLVLHAGILAVVGVRQPTPPEASNRNGQQIIATLEIDSTGHSATAAQAAAPPVVDGPPVPAFDDNPTDRVAESDAAVDLDKPAATDRPRLEPADAVESNPQDSAAATESDSDAHRDTGEPSGAAEGAPQAPWSIAPSPRIEPPRPLAEISPNYPMLARRRGLEGEVVIQVTIAPSGEPVETTIVSPSAHRLLNEAAVAAVQTARFQPGTVDDEPTRMNLSIRIVFRVS